jgi:DNA replication and repair protein RecF
MRIKKLELTNFRSYKELSLEFAPGVSTFIGDNGCGKTNIAESIIYLAFLSSHRVSSNQPLITLGSEQAIIRAEIAREDRTLQVDLEINLNKANRARLNQNPTRSQREILGACQVIYFSPEDLDLVRGDPNQRRDFLDKLLLPAPRESQVLLLITNVLLNNATLCLKLDHRPARLRHGVNN